MNKLVRYNNDRYQDLLVLALFFVLPFFHKYSNFIFQVILLFSIVAIVRKKRMPDLSMHWFLPALFLYYTLSNILSGAPWTFIEKRLLLLFIPLTFALTSRFYRSDLQPKIYLAYVIGNLLAMVTCVVRAVIRSVVIDDHQWVFNAKVIPNSNHDFLTSSVMGGNYFFGPEFSFFHHPTYASLHIILAQYFVFELVKIEVNVRKKRWLVGCYLIFLIVLFFLSSKAAIITSIAVTFWILLKYPLSRGKKITLIAAVMVVGLLFLFLNPRMKVFKDTLVTSNVINPDARYGHDLRILSWDASLSLIRENWLLGVGEANKDNRLETVYADKGYVVPAELGLNSHNQYLDFWIGGGLIGIGLFLAGLLSLTMQSIKESNYPLFAFLFIFAFNCLFENLLSRHDGILFFSIFVAYLTHQRNKWIVSSE